MLEISAKLKKKTKKKLVRYWSLLEPKSYAKKMVAVGSSIFEKTAGNKLSPVTLKAKLRRNKAGFHYLDIPDDVVHGLYKLIDEEGIEKPPYFGKGDRKVGAHVSVISDDELKEFGIDKIKEVGQEFSFELGDMFSVKPDGWKEMERVWFVSVDSDELKELRKRYGLPATYQAEKKQWHCTIAVRKAKKK